jgi:hypothetical protein
MDKQDEKRKRLIYCKFCGLTFENEEDYKCHRVYKHSSKFRAG